MIQLGCHCLLEALLGFFPRLHGPPSTDLNNGPIIPRFSSRLFGWEFEALTLVSGLSPGEPLRRINQTDVLIFACVWAGVAVLEDIVGWLLRMLPTSIASPAL